MPFFTDSIEYLDYAVFFLITAVYGYLLPAYLRWSESLSLSCLLAESSRSNRGSEDEPSGLLVEAALLKKLEEYPSGPVGIPLVNGHTKEWTAHPLHSLTDTEVSPGPGLLTLGDAPVVLDLGTGVVKIGLGGVDRFPHTKFPNILGRPKYQKSALMGPNENYYIGEETEPPKRGILHLSYPMENGVVAHWDQVEKLLLHVFAKLGVSSRTQPVIVTSSLNDRPVDREKLTEILFEKFSVPALYMVSQSQLVMLASGKSTGLIVQCGDGETRTVPIVEGHIIHQASRTLEVTGRNLTEYLADLLNNRGKFGRTTTAQLEMVRDMKEKLAYVALDRAEETTKSKKSAAMDVLYELPDGQTIPLNDERFLCMEPLFQPTLLGRQCGGLHEIIRDSISACDKNIQDELWRNIVLAGGTTICPGFEERLYKELQCFGVDAHIFASLERDNLAWIGGSILASSGLPASSWTTKSGYMAKNSPVVERLVRPDLVSAQ